MSTIKFKLTKNVIPIKLANANFAYVSAPGSTPTIATKAVNDLSSYSNTEAMLNNVATAYANSINYVDSKSFVNSALLSANLANYTNSSSLELDSLNNVDSTQATNNSVLVYDSVQDKYVIKQIDLDGGNF